MIFFVGYCKVVCEITFLGKGVMLPAEGKIKLMPDFLEGLASCFFISLYPFYFKIEPSLLKKRRVGGSLIGSWWFIHSQILRLKSYQCSFLLPDSSVTLNALQLMAHTTFVLRGQRLLPELRKSAHNRPCPVPSYWPAAGSLFHSFSYLPTQKQWLSLASGSHVLKFYHFWEENSQKERIAWFSGFLGRGCFCLSLREPLWTVGGEIRNQPVFLLIPFLLKMRMEWESTRNWVAFAEPEREYFRLGQEGREAERRSVLSCRLNFLRTSSLGSCDHSWGFAGC